MTDEAARGFCRALRDALLECQPDHIALLLDDNVEWAVFGPIDLFSFFGQRRGKDAVLALVGQIISSLQFVRCENETTVSAPDSAASLVRVTALHMKSGRTLTFRLAFFMQFRNGKLTALKALLDSFDAAEQALGRHIDLATIA